MPKPLSFPYYAYQKIGRKAFKCQIGGFLPFECCSWILKGLKEKFNEMARLHEFYGHPYQAACPPGISYYDNLLVAKFNGEEKTYNLFFKIFELPFEASSLASLWLEEKLELIDGNLAVKEMAKYFALITREILRYLEKNGIAAEVLQSLKEVIPHNLPHLVVHGCLVHGYEIINLLIKLLEGIKTLNVHKLEIYKKTDPWLQFHSISWHLQLMLIKIVDGNEEKIECKAYRLLMPVRHYFFVFYLIKCILDKKNVEEAMANIFFRIYQVFRIFYIDPVNNLTFYLPGFSPLYKKIRFFTFLKQGLQFINEMLMSHINISMKPSPVHGHMRDLMYKLACYAKKYLRSSHVNLLDPSFDAYLGVKAVDLFVEAAQREAEKYKKYKNGGYHDLFFKTADKIIEVDKKMSYSTPLLSDVVKEGVKVLSTFDKGEVREAMMDVLPRFLTGEKAETAVRKNAELCFNTLIDDVEELEMEGLSPNQVFNLFFVDKYVPLIMEKYKISRKVH